MGPDVSVLPVLKLLKPFLCALCADARCHVLEEPQHRGPHRRQHSVILVPLWLIGMCDAVPLHHRRFRDDTGFEADEGVRNLVGRRRREPRRALGGSAQQAFG